MLNCNISSSTAYIDLLVNGIFLCYFSFMWPLGNKAHQLITLTDLMIEQLNECSYKIVFINYFSVENILFFGSNSSGSKKSFYVQNFIIFTQKEQLFCLNAHIVHYGNGGHLENGSHSEHF